jgi:hypothetical protein
MGRFYLCAILRAAGVSNPRTRKSVDMDSFAAASLRSGGATLDLNPTTSIRREDPPRRVLPVFP